jgi:hypothetical protein
MSTASSEYQWPMPEEWKVLVLAEMKRRRMTKSAVAAQLGVSVSNVTNALKPVANGGYRTSAYAVQIGEIVGIPLPSRPSDDPAEVGVSLMRTLYSLSPAVYADEVRELDRRVERLRKAMRPARRR